MYVCMYVCVYVCVCVYVGRSLGILIEVVCLRTVLRNKLCDVSDSVISIHACAPLSYCLLHYVYCGTYTYLYIHVVCTTCIVYA